MIDVVTCYLDSVLLPQLSDYGVSRTYCSEIKSVVERQMLSAIYNWDNKYSRRALMLLVSEESRFYQPDAPEDIKAFVVLTVRNSPFEKTQSNCYVETGLKSKLTNEQIVAVTSEAISYFSTVDLISLARKTPYSDNDARNDEYWLLSGDYPIAWNALEQLATHESPCSFQSYMRKDKDEFEKEFAVKDNMLKKYRKTIIDGFDPVIEPDLCIQLNYIAQSRGVFFIDCYKMLSRNPEKVLKVLEYLLINDSCFVTSNYYIKNGYAEKRASILKAASSDNPDTQIAEHLRNLTGAGIRHRSLLKQLRKEYFP